jgi:hypothetical protein
MACWQRTLCQASDGATPNRARRGALDSTQSPCDRNATGWLQPRVPPALSCLALAVLLAFSGARSVSAASGYSLEWNTARNQVSADIESAELFSVLQRVATATRWQIFLEPKTAHTISAKFQNLTSGDALRFLLGDLNFALIPGTNSGGKLYVFRTDRDNATELVPPAKSVTGGNRIPNELIVRLKPGANIEEVAKALGAKVVGRIDKFNAYRLRFDDEAATTSARDSLAANPDVSSVDDNFAIDRPPVPLGMPGGVAPPVLQMRPPPDSGRVIVGLVDTAVQPLCNNLDQFLLKAISVAGGASLDPNSPSHGTAMAETMLRSLQQTTKGTTAVQILPVDVYGPGESTSTFDVANGIVQAVNGGARVINLSLGSAGDSPFLHDVVRNAREASILLISAAGNQPVTTPFYPAAYPEVDAVTAIDRGALASYASRGSYVTLGGPGTSLIPFGSQAFGVQGTSVSSAFISGAAAGYMDANRATTAQAQSFLRNSFGVTVRPRP